MCLTILISYLVKDMGDLCRINVLTVWLLGALCSAICKSPREGKDCSESQPQENPITREMGHAVIQTSKEFMAFAQKNLTMKTNYYLRQLLRTVTNCINISIKKYYFLMPNYFALLFFTFKCLTATT